MFWNNGTLLHECPVIFKNIHYRGRISGELKLNMIKTEEIKQNDNSEFMKDILRLNML